MDVLSLVILLLLLLLFDVEINVIFGAGANERYFIINIRI